MISETIQLLSDWSSFDTWIVFTAVSRPEAITDCRQSGLAPLQLVRENRSELLGALLHLQVELTLQLLHLAIDGSQPLSQRLRRLLKK